MKSSNPNSKDTLEANSVKIYRTCEEMPLWNFHKFSETNDLKYFTENLKIVEGLEKVKVEMMKEYAMLSNSKKYEKRISKIENILFLTNKYDSVTMLLFGLRNCKPTEGQKIFEGYFEAFEKWGYRIDTKDLINLYDQLDKIERRIQGIITKIEMLECELKDEGIVSSEKITLESQVLSVSRILSLGYKIDVRTTTVMEWIEYQKECERLFKAQQNNKNGK